MGDLHAIVMPCAARQHGMRKPSEPAVDALEIAYALGFISCTCTLVQSFALPGGSFRAGGTALGSSLLSLLSLLYEVCWGKGGGWYLCRYASEEVRRPVLASPTLVRDWIRRRGRPAWRR